MYRLISTLLLTPIFAAGALAETHAVYAYSTWFSPSEITVVPGDTIRWEYVTGYPHTVTSGMPCVADGLFDGDLNGSGDVFEWVVPDDVPASIPYFCDPHCKMGMTAQINVTAGPPGQGVLTFGSHEIGSDGSGWVDVEWQSDAPILGYQFNLLGATITDVCCGLTEQYEWNVTHNGVLVLAYAFGTAAIPAQEDPATLLRLTVAGAGTELSFDEAIFAGSDGLPLKVDASDVLELDGCDGDVNADGVVDVTDLLSVIAAWGDQGGDADVNGDGSVDVSDVLAIISAWGPC